MARATCARDGNQKLSRWPPTQTCETCLTWLLTRVCDALSSELSTQGLICELLNRGRLMLRATNSSLRTSREFSPRKDQEPGPLEGKYPSRGLLREARGKTPGRSRN